MTVLNEIIELTDALKAINDEKQAIMSQLTELSEKMESIEADYNEVAALLKLKTTEL